METKTAGFTDLDHSRTIHVALYEECGTVVAVVSVCDGALGVDESVAAAIHEVLLGPVLLVDAALDGVDYT